jgi:hypothetical protein
MVMVSTTLRDAPPLAWPALRRAGGVKLVYLDQKDWVHLAQADTGHRDGTRYAAALRAARDARAAGTAVFPLSLTHYSETLKMTSVRHRSDLARLMEELSGFAALPVRRLTALYELDAAVTTLTSIPASTLPEVDLLGRGFRWAHGVRADGRIVKLDGSDSTGLLRERLGTETADTLMAAFDLFTERMMLTGPSDADLPKLQALGYDPAAIVQAAQDRADNEAAFSQIVPDDVRRHPTRLLDRVLARELNTPDMVGAWKELAGAYGMRVFDVLPELDPAAARTLTRSMPGAEVAAVLKTGRHRNTTLTWTSNDMFDIDALTVAVPYCDIVGADNAQAHALTITHLADRMGTVIMRSVADLPAHL